MSKSFPVYFSKDKETEVWGFKDELRWEEPAAHEELERGNDTSASHLPKVGSWVLMRETEGGEESEEERVFGEEGGVSIPKGVEGRKTL